MSKFNIDELTNKYGGFVHTSAEIEVNDVSFGSKKGFPVSDVCVDLTCGFDASSAEFSIYDAFDKDEAKYKFDDVKKFIFLGSKCEIYLGYGTKTRSVFKGVVTRVNFLFEEDGIPCIRVTAMDIKAIMMSSCYSKQLKANNYSDAVSEILGKMTYDKLKNAGIVTDIVVNETPDKTRNSKEKDESKLASKTIEMVAESDYEFVVKAAKKNNFEFFTECGNIYFRKAKSDDTVLMEIGPQTGMKTYDISYDITGLVEKVVVRSTDVSKAKVIQAEKKFSNKISNGNKAAQYIKKSEKVYIDPTCSSQEEALDRAQSLLETMSYRLGTLKTEMVGIPELLPGHFVEVKGLGQGPDNKFYMTRVIHRLHKEGYYTCEIEGIAAAIGASSKKL